MGEVAAVVESHGQDRVARLEQRLVGGEVGVGPGVGLHVGVLGPEESALGASRASSSTSSMTWLPP